MFCWALQYTTLNNNSYVMNKLWHGSWVVVVFQPLLTARIVWLKSRYWMPIFRPVNLKPLNCKHGEFLMSVALFKTKVQSKLQAGSLLLVVLWEIRAFFILSCLSFRILMGLFWRYCRLIIWAASLMLLVRKSIIISSVKF